MRVGQFFLHVIAFLVVAMLSLASCALLLMGYPLIGTIFMISSVVAMTSVLLKMLRLVQAAHNNRVNGRYLDGS